MEWIKTATNESDKIATSKFGIWWIKFIQVGITVVIVGNILNSILLSVQRYRKWLSNIYDIGKG